MSCIDGGAVNNTPLGYALDHPFEIDRVFVVSPQPRVASSRATDAKGIGLAMHLADMLVEERLYRDLRGAYAVNAALARLAQVVPDAELRAQVLETVGWGGAGKRSRSSSSAPRASCVARCSTASSRERCGRSTSGRAKRPPAPG